MNKQETRNALRMLRAALEEATDTENFDYQRGRQPSKKHADFVMRLKAGIEELEKELKGSKRNPRYLVSRDGTEVGIFPGFNALMAINAARKIYGPGKYSSVKTGEAMFLGRGALQAEERLREETAARAARKAAAKRDKIQAPRKRKNATRFYPGDKEAIISGYTAASQRINNGMNRFIEAVKEQFGFSDEEANSIMRAFIRHKIVTFQNNQFNLTHGAYWEKPVMQRALIDQAKWEKKRKANPLEKSAEHPIEVTRHYRSGGPNYLSPWQRAMAIGQEELFDTGIKLAPRAAQLRAARNPGATKRAYESGLKEATAAQLARLVRVGLRVGLSMAQIKKDLEAADRFTAAQIDRAMDQARIAEERLAKRPNPRELQRADLQTFTLYKDGIEGKEIPASLVPFGDETAWQYALGYTEADDPEPSVFRRGAWQRGTYGGWRREMYPNKLLQQNPRRGRLRFLKPDIIFDYTKHPEIVIIRGVSLSAKTRINGMVREGEANRHTTQPFNKGYAFVLKQYGSGRTDKKLFEREGYVVREVLPKTYTDGLKKKKFDVDPVKIARFGLAAGLAPRDIEEDLENTGQYNPIEIIAILAEALTVQNPSVKAIYQKFNGRPSRRSRNVAAPAGTPRDLAQLGRLRTIKTVDGRTWRFPGDRAPFLAADSQGKLHIVGGQYRANPAGEDCGEIDLIEYQTRKPHLGHHKETIYYHKLGEDTGERPTLEITPAGEIVIHGGAYRIESDGIHN